MNCFPNEPYDTSGKTLEIIKDKTPTLDKSEVYTMTYSCRGKVCLGQNGRQIGINFTIVL